MPSDSDQKVRDRIDLNRKVQLRFEKFQDFLTEIAANISTGGMFVRSDEPHEPGERFEFECSLADGYPLVSGRAEVVWTRDQTSSAGRAAGMGVRFLELRDKSEMLIRRIVEQRIKAGEKPFELEQTEAPGAKAPKTPDEAPVPPSGGESSRAGSKVPKAAKAPAEAPMPPSSGESSGAGVSSGEAASAPSSPRPPGPRGDPPARTVEVEPTSAPSKTPAPPNPLPAASSSTASSAPPAAATAQSPPSVEPAARGPAPRMPASRVAPSEAKAVKQPTAPSLRSAVPPVSSALATPRGAAPEAKGAAPPRTAVAGRVDSPKPGVPSQSAPRDRKRLGLVRILELALISGLAGAFMVLAFNQYWVRPRIERLEARLEELTGAASVESPAVLAQTEDPRGEIAPAGTDLAAVEAGAQADPAERVMPEAEPAAVETAGAPAARPTPQDAVQEWARAWSDQRVEDYLAFYSADFVPASGLSRAAWEQRRRERLSAQGAIRVAVVSLQVEELGPAEVRATFTQSYRSNVYRDRVRKSMRLSWIGDRWQIVEEAVIRQLPW